MTDSHWESVVSHQFDLQDALQECTAHLHQSFADKSIDILLVFASRHYIPFAREISEGIQFKLHPKQVLGCCGNGVIGAGEEIEQHIALSMLAGHLPEVNVQPFFLNSDTMPSPDASPGSWHEATGLDNQGQTNIVLMTDPFSLNTSECIQGLDYAFPQSTIVGGVASTGRKPGETVLFLQDQVHHQGAVGIALHGNIRMDSLVTQGCRAIGKTMTVTRCHDNIIQSLNRKTPLEILNELSQEVGPRDKKLMQNSLFIGIAQPDFDKPEAESQYLVRNILGLDPNQGILAVGELMRPGQQVQFFLRDALTSTEDLKQILSEYAGPQPQAMLQFSCTGRGVPLFGKRNHDSDLFKSVLGDQANAGFFCGGEIGPLSQTTFVHGFTTVFAVFSEQEKSKESESSNKGQH